MTRGVATIQQLRARCDCETVPGCWLWKGGCTDEGTQPRVWTFDHARGEKRAMSGALAAWNIAFETPPLPGQLIFRTCQRTLCLRPEHLSKADNKAQIGAHIRRIGSRCGTATESRRRNILKAHALRGFTPVPDAVVLAIRAAPADVTPGSLARVHGLQSTTVSRIRLGQSHRHLL